MVTTRIWISGILVGIAGSLLASQLPNRPSGANVGAVESPENQSAAEQKIGDQRSQLTETNKKAESVADPAKNESATKQRIGDQRSQLAESNKQAESVAEPSPTAIPLANSDELVRKAREELQQTAKDLAETSRKLTDAEEHVALLESGVKSMRRLFNTKQEELDVANGQVQTLSRQIRSLERSLPTQAQKNASLKLYGQGLEELFRGNHAESAKLLSEAIAIYPSDARYRYFRGLAYSRQNLSAAARADFQDASAFENRGEPDRTEVSTALQRIQGREREILESFRPKPQE